MSSQGWPVKCCENESDFGNALIIYGLAGRADLALDTERAAIFCAALTLAPIDLPLWTTARH